MIIESGSAQTVIEKNQITANNISKKIQGVSIIVKTPVKSLDFYKAIE